MNKYIIELKLFDGHVEYYTGKTGFIFWPNYMFSPDKNVAKKFSNTQESLLVLNAVRNISRRKRWGATAILTMLKPEKEVYHG